VHTPDELLARILDAVASIKRREDQLRRTTRDLRTRVAKCTEVDGKIAVPFQAWSRSEGSRKLRFPDFMTTAQDGGKVVGLTHRPPLPTGNECFWYSFLLEAESTPGP